MIFLLLLLMSGNNKKIVLFGALVAAVGVWYWWNYIRKKEIPPVPIPAPVPPVPPVSPEPAPAESTYKIGDRVTFGFPLDDHPSCKEYLTYIGSICGRNTDGTYNVSWEAVHSSRSPSDPSSPTPHCQKMQRTMPKSVYNEYSPLEDGRNPVSFFGTCGTRPTHKDLNKYNIPDHFTAEQLKALQLPNKVMRSITVANKPELCAGSRPSNFILQGTRCSENPKRISWEGVYSASAPPPEYETQFQEGKCGWIRAPETNTAFTSLFGDCTKGSALLDTSILPYENNENDLFPTEL